MSADAGKPVRCAYFAAGASSGIARIRSTNAPGKPTGDLFVSGAAKDGYFIAKLDNNFVKAPPARAAWVRNIAAGGDHAERQPWDVAGDSRVVFAEGKPFSPDWSAVRRLAPDGKDDIVPDWRYHFGLDAAGQKVEGNWTPANARRDVKVNAGAVVFKVNGRFDNRSWTNAEYDLWQDDGNGAPRKGAWPLNAFFGAPADLNNPKALWSAGYTGYKIGSNPTQRIGDIAIDRRNGDLYIGISIQTRLPEGQPDFEPAVLAQSASGKMKWWSRLYSEFVDKNNNGTYDEGEPRNSTPDQYVDFLALDYSALLLEGGTLVVGARAHGNNIIGFWNGDKIAARPTAKGFKTVSPARAATFTFRGLASWRSMIVRFGELPRRSAGRHERRGRAVARSASRWLARPQRRLDEHQHHALAVFERL